MCWWLRKNLGCRRVMKLGTGIGYVCWRRCLGMYRAWSHWFRTRRLGSSSAILWRSASVVISWLLWSVTPSSALDVLVSLVHLLRITRLTHITTKFLSNRSLGDVTIQSFCFVKFSEIVQESLHPL